MLTDEEGGSYIVVINVLDTDGELLKKFDLQVVITRGKKEGETKENEDTNTDTDTDNETNNE